MYKYRLMVPGPTPTPPDVTAAGLAPMEDERTARYAAVFTRVLRNLGRVMLTRNDVLLFSASVTGAFEGAVQNLFSGGDRVVVVNTGAFGQRWVEMARAYGLDVVEVAQPWGEPVDLARVAAATAPGRGVKAAICVHCETSTGTVNDVAGFAAAARDVVSVVDSASGAGSCELRTDEWGIDVVVTGGHKALMTPPGLGAVSIGPRAWQLHRQARLPRYYFDWGMARDARDSAVPRTPWTPSISLINQLDVALGRLLDEGVDAVFERHVRLGRITRAGVCAMGLELFSPDEDRSAAVTAVRVPAGLDGEAVVDRLLDRYAIQLTGGSGRLAGSVVRIGHCGYVDAFDILATLAGLGLTLQELGHQVDAGAGVAAAVRAMADPGADRPLVLAGIPTEEKR
jgi:aspartate aminotransferase-like enzyme